MTMTRAAPMLAQVRLLTPATAATAATQATLAIATAVTAATAATAVIHPLAEDLL